MKKEIIPVEIEYSTSLEKWKGIRKFAKLNGLDTNKIDAMIARIEEVGDAVMGETFTFEINGMESFSDSIFNAYYHPCPHCCKYETCSECPLDDYEEWNEVREEMFEIHQKVENPPKGL